MGALSQLHCVGLLCVSSRGRLAVLRTVLNSFVFVDDVLCSIGLPMCDCWSCCLGLRIARVIFVVVLSDLR
jgi:hypothetical protein